MDSIINEDVSALVIGDPHFKVANIRETDAMVEAITRVARERNPDIIIVLGDVLDRHETIHVSPLTRAIKFLGRLREIAPTYVLIGNHDLKNNRQFLSDEHPFCALKYWGNNMTIVDTTTMIHIKGKMFVLVPYVPPGRFIEALNVCPGWERAICIFGHQEFKGAQMGAIVSTEGDDWPLTYPNVVTGHIHDYQEPQVNILYTGTPIQHAFGDRHDKTISYFVYTDRPEIQTEIQTKTGSVHDRRHERIDLGLPRKQIVRITCAEVSTYTPQSNCELKIIIKGTSGEIKAIMKHPSIETWKKAGYKIAYKDLPLDRSGDDNSVEGGPIISRAPLRFSTVLYNAISNNDRLGALYTRIFGSIKSNILTLKIGSTPTKDISQLTIGINNMTLLPPSTQSPRSTQIPQSIQIKPDITLKPRIMSLSLKQL